MIALHAPRIIFLYEILPRCGPVFLKSSSSQWCNALDADVNHSNLYLPLVKATKQKAQGTQRCSSVWMQWVSHAWRGVRLPPSYISSRKKYEGPFGLQVQCCPISDHPCWFGWAWKCVTMFQTPAAKKNYFCTRRRRRRKCGQKIKSHRFWGLLKHLILL